MPPKESPDSAAESIVTIASTDDLDDGDRLITDVAGREIAVFRINGEYHAVLNFCPHQGGPACAGYYGGCIQADDDGDMVFNDERPIVACPWHGWEFDLRTGTHLSGSGYALLVYDVIIEDEYIKVRLG